MTEGGKGFRLLLKKEKALQIGNGLLSFNRIRIENANVAFRTD
jgi:hypothetical protein